jgi:glutamine cyclotransferase
MALFRLYTLKFLGLTALIFFLAACKKEEEKLPPPPTTTTQPPPAPSIPTYTYEVVATYPHDVKSFTEGFQFDGGFIYEGTGMEARSYIRKYDLKSGKVIKEVKLPDYYFGEGIILLGGKIYELTYTSQIGFIYDAKTFAKIDSFTYQGEGWGMTTDGTNLIFSNGSNKLQYLDPNNHQVVKTLEVFEGENPLMQINELEYIKGQIFANIWRADRIVIIDPASGKVTGTIDMRGLLSPSEQTRETDVLNGIAYDAKNDRIFVTGKNWPKIFEIKIKKKELAAAR